MPVLTTTRRAVVDAFPRGVGLAALPTIFTAALPEGPGSATPLLLPGGTTPLGRSL
mgnify:CR=1 FL=1